MTTTDDWTGTADGIRAKWMAGCAASNRRRECLSPLGMSKRLLRLLACACCRNVWHVLADKRSRKAVEVAERYADGTATEEELRVDRTAAYAAYAAAAAAAAHAAADADAAAQAAARRAEWRSQGEILVVLVGPGWAFDPNWRTATAVALARAAYDNHDWSLTPILADALQDAGCDAEDVLEHLRGPGPHFRGMRIVDELLGLR
jgi:hypothetical protein